MAQAVVESQRHALALQFGNGFGAFVALELAIRHGTRFRRLLVADSVAAFPEPARLPFRGMAAKVRANGMQAVLDTAIGRMFPAEFQAAHPDVVAARKARLAPANAGWRNHVGRSCAKSFSRCSSANASRWPMSTVRRHLQRGPNVK